jgi:CBS domain-containing protein
LVPISQEKRKERTNNYVNFQAESVALWIRELMTTRPAVVNPAASIREAARIMTRGHFRHLPVWR